MENLSTCAIFFAAPCTMADPFRQVLTRTMSHRFTMMAVVQPLRPHEDPHRSHFNYAVMTVYCEDRTTRATASVISRPAHQLFRLARAGSSTTCDAGSIYLSRHFMKGKAA